MRIYKEFLETRTGTKIPVFLSGRTMESRYNPEKEAENFCSTIEDGFNFFLVFGIGSGIFLGTLAERFPEAKIIALELFEEDIEFLMESSNLKALKKNPSIIVTSLKNLSECLSRNYIPAKYGDLKILEQKAWINENKKYAKEISSVLNKSIGIISADFSVQSHFGRIWNNNIIKNSMTAEKLHLKRFPPQNLQSKTAVIVAAGPTLDKTCSMLNERKNFYIIATDTASQTLISRNIIPDVIISIDGQSISSNHFLKKDKDTAPLYAFDLCANYSAVNKIAEAGNDIIFFSSGHPLAAAVNISCNSPLPFLYSGAGTVTITALDFAIQAGFKKILILGADFSYSGGKAYAAGTYLDSLYNKNSFRVQTNEYSFVKLLYRTNIEKLSDSSFTTQILDAYRLSLEDFLKSNNILFKKNKDVYELECQNSSRIKTVQKCTGVVFSLKPFLQKIAVSNPEESETFLLPYIAWLRTQKKYKGCSYEELLKLAFNSIVRYNI